MKTSPPEAQTAPARKCHCVINHPVTDEERAELDEAFGCARAVGDSLGLLLLVARLAGPCPARV
ncbi:hypothetical protein [Streptomyces sp. NPDC059378]|uniref:hypothetical protein n=1 Tax=Streptomyces sp. NPDC059378 TaxID=3346815 RepID=UPI0036AE3A98